MRYSLISFLLAAFTFSPLNVFAQSADAGMSSMQARLRDPRNQSIGLTYLYGNSGPSGDSTVRQMKYYSFILSGGAEVLGGVSLWASVPINQQNGLLGSVTGVGDVMALVTKSVFTVVGTEFSVGVGARFATGTVNQDHLPQAYQSGIGSNDFLLEANAISKVLNFGIAYQISGHRNTNELTKLQQGDQFVVTAGYTYRGDGFDIGMQLLGIKQLQESSILNPLSQSTSFINVAGSDDLQVDVLLKARGELTGWLSLVGTAGFPINPRNINVDGLTRAYTISLGMAVSL